MRIRRRFLRSLRLLACVLLALVARPAAAAPVTVDAVACVVLAPVAAETSEAKAPREATSVTHPASDGPRRVAESTARPALEATSFRASRDVYLLHCSLLC